MSVTKAERLSALQAITLELTHGECPCGHCMGPGCEECQDTGAALDSLKSIRDAFAKALEVVARAKPDVTEQLARDLRASGAR